MIYYVSVIIHHIQKESYAGFEPAAYRLEVCRSAD